MIPFNVVTRMREAMSEAQTLGRKVLWIGVSEPDFDNLKKLAREGMEKKGVDVPDSAIPFFFFSGLKIAQIQELAEGTIRVCWVEAPPEMKHMADAAHYLLGPHQGKIFLGGKEVTGKFKIKLETPAHVFAEGEGGLSRCKKCGIQKAYHWFRCDPGGPWKDLAEKLDPLP